MMMGSRIKTWLKPMSFWWASHVSAKRQQVCTWPWQYGLKAANYPLIPEDFERGQLPKDLIPFRQKIFGLMIDAERLSEIRNERWPGSNYAKLENCRYEINEATAMMKKQSIPWVLTTSKSIEEIATTVLQAIKSDKTILG